MSRKNIWLKWFGRGNIDDIETLSSFLLTTLTSLLSFSFLHYVNSLSLPLFLSSFCLTTLTSLLSFPFLLSVYSLSLPLILSPFLLTTLTSLSPSPLFSWQWELLDTWVKDSSCCSPTTYTYNTQPFTEIPHTQHTLCVRVRVVTQHPTLMFTTTTGSVGWSSLEINMWLSERYIYILFFLLDTNLLNTYFCLKICKYFPFTKEKTPKRKFEIQKKKNWTFSSFLAFAKNKEDISTFQCEILELGS